jgi:PAS domain S-box-containing protein
MYKRWLKHIKHFLNSNLSVKQYLYVALTIYIVGISGFLIYSYTEVKNDIYKSVDKQIVKAASSIDYMLPMNYHDKAISSKSIDDIEFNEITQLLSLHANNYEVKYLYSIIEQNGKLYFTSSSATSDEIRTGQNLTYYWQEYNEADSGFYNAFHTNKTTFVDYTDRWGTFRTAIIPRISSAGNKYIICADIETSFINAEIFKNLLFVILKALFFTIIILPLFYVLYKYYKVVTGNYQSVLLKQTHQLTLHQELQKQSIQSLKQTEEKFNALFYTSPLPMIIIDKKGKIIDSNNAFYDFVGLSKSEVNNHIIFTLPFFNSAGDFETICQKLQADKKLLDYSINVSGYKGETPVKIWGSILELFNMPHYVLIIQNISQEKQLFTDLENAKKIAEDTSTRKSMFLANMSHEIRTPLNAIVGFADLLREDYDKEEARNEYINIITLSCRNLLMLINDLIDFSKIEAGQLKISEKPCYLNQMMKRLDFWLHEEITSKKLVNVNHLLTLGLDDADSIIFSDELRISQVVTNLLSNALKFTSHGTIEFGYKVQSNALLFFVKDSGAGMSSEDLEKIFIRFEQGMEGSKEKYNGTGLGLSISKKIVELLNGKIWVESEQNIGTTFYFSIPHKMIDEKKRGSLIKSALEPENDINDYHWEGLSFLLAETEQANMNFLLKVIEKNKGNVLVSNSYAELINIMEEQPLVNFIVFDLSFEVLNLTQFITQVKSKNKNLKIIATSSNPYIINIDKSKKLGFDALLIKPFTRNDFEMTVFRTMAAKE